MREAVEIGNATSSGSGSAMFTRDEAEMNRAIEKLVAGATFANSIVASDPRLRFGGLERAGSGRETFGDGMSEFVSRETIVVAS